MKHRTQLYLSEEQHRWLRRQARTAGGSIASVVRDLIDERREVESDPLQDPFVRFLLDGPHDKGGEPSSVTTIDQDIYGHDGPELRD